MSDSVSESPDLIRDLLATPIPRQLWHYTSYQGFQGIVESKTIWATDLRYLNDTQEFIHARELAEKRADQIAASWGAVSEVKEMVKKAINAVFNTGPLHPERSQVMVASFSHARDQLSQWRGYSGGSSGVSISFDLSRVRPSYEIGTAAVFAPCVYNLSDKNALLECALSHMFDVVFEWARDDQKAIQANPELIPPDVKSPSFDRRLKQARIDFNYSLARLCPLLKDSSFSEEREWRLVLLASTDAHLKDQVNYRATRDSLIPYTAYPLGEPDQPIPVNGLILGPGSHPKAKEATAAFLRANKVSVVPELSKVPYRAS